VHYGGYYKFNTGKVWKYGAGEEGRRSIGKIV
jgi:hypothetical protein